MDFACAKLLRDAGFEQFDAVAGGETAGIPFAAWIAERLGLPMLYVRKQPKGFGRDAQIEGALAEGARVLLVEDLTTDGGSKIGFAEAIRAAGGEVAHTLRVLLLRHFPRGRGGDGGARAHGSTTSPPGATCWRRRGRAGSSTRRRWPRSRPSSARRSTGRRRMAAWTGWRAEGRAAG